MSIVSLRPRASRAAVRRPSMHRTFIRRALFRHLHLPGILIGSMLAFTASAALAQTNTLPAVQVTATRTPIRIDEAISEVTVIERSQIERATGRTLPELLAQQPGVQFTANGGPGTASSVYLRGLEARHTLLLIDGVRYGSATLGTPAWENLPLDAIERIEIVRGPLSGLYGSDAVGGVIQIFTRRSAPGLHANGNLTLGSNAARQIGAGLSFGQGALDGAVQLLHTRTRGFSATNSNEPFGSFNADADGFRQNSLSGQLGMSFGAGWRVDGRVLASHGETQYDDGPGVDSRAALRSEVLALELGGPVTSAWRSKLRVSRSTDAYETLASASAFTDLGTTATVQQQIAWQNSVVTPLGTALVIAEHLQQKVSRPVTPYDVSDRRINSLGLGLEGRAGRNTWQASLRHDRNSQFGAQTTGAAGYGFDITPTWRAAASYGTSFVAPSFNQLYYPNFGNPDLLPEEGRQAEISLRWEANGHELRAAYFDNRIRGYISSGPAPVNVPKTQIDGVSLSYQAKVGAWTGAASAEHVNPRNATEGSANLDKQLPRRAKDSLKLAADHDHGAWQLGGVANAFSHRFDDSANARRLGGYATLDLHADWRFAPAWALGLRLNNLANRQYETVYGYNQPGREVYATLRYSAL